jgi:hypothetical protein
MDQVAGTLFEDIAISGGLVSSAGGKASARLDLEWEI